MARATTENFAQMIVEVEWVASSGTYAKVCGLTSRGVSRVSNMTSSSIPDCDDETLPAAIGKSVDSQEVTISGSGVWASESHGKMMDWFYSGATKNVRIQNVLAASGDTEYETGPAYLTNLSNSVERGQKVTAEISIEFDGLPSRTDKS